MGRLLMTTAAAALMFVSTVTAVNRANAMPLGSLSAVRATIFDLNIVDRVQYFWGGKRYCWYDEGWNGSGWYWCGYSDRPKLGWGGPKGFRGWVAGRGTSSGNAAGDGRDGTPARDGGTGRGTGGAGRVGGGDGRVGGGRPVGGNGPVGVGEGRVAADTPPRRAGPGGARVGAPRPRKTPGSNTSPGSNTGHVSNPGRAGNGARAVGSNRFSRGNTSSRGGSSSGRSNFGGGSRGGASRGRGFPQRSDIAIKHHIMLLGHLDNGLGFYRFSYNGSDKAYVGVMAQEVRILVPEAVAPGSDGYLTVSYDKLGLKFQTYERWLASGAHVPEGLR